MGIGSARRRPFRRGAEMAISSPLLEASIDGAHGVLLSVSGGSDLGLFEVTRPRKWSLKPRTRTRTSSSEQ